MRALWPEDVHWWLSTTQPEEYAKVVQGRHAGEQADREALLDSLVARLDTPMSSGGGTLNVLRRKFSHTRGATAHLRMCQFKPATTLNRDVTERMKPCGCGWSARCISRRTAATSAPSTWCSSSTGCRSRRSS